MKKETTRPIGLRREALKMYDSFSGGNVYYGRTLAVGAAIMALAVLLNLL